MEFATYPTMIPMINSSILLRTIEEKKKSSNVISIAPTNAASKMAKKPLTEKAAVVTFPPNKSITKATPNPAPLLMPNMPGPAKGFRNAVCNNKPQADKAAPVSNAVKACGNLDSMIIYSQEGCIAKRFDVTSSCKKGKIT